MVALNPPPSWAPIRVFRWVRVVVGCLAIVKGVALALHGAPVALLIPWFACAGLMAVEVAQRLAAIGLVVLGVILFLTGFHSNQAYLMLILCFLLVLPSENTWVLWLMRWQLSIVYGFAAVAKINESWMSGCALEVFFGRAMLPLDPLLGLAQPIALSVIGVEALLAVAPWFARLRLSAVFLAAGTHLGMLVVAISWADLIDLFVFAGLTGVLFASFFAHPVCRFSEPK